MRSLSSMVSQYLPGALWSNAGWSTGRLRGIGLVCCGLVLMLGIGCVSATDVKTSGALRDLGVSYLNEGNNEAALRELIKARELNPKDARIHHELGLAFFAKGLEKKAEQEMLSAIKLDPTLSEARLNLSSLYISQERYGDAVAQLKVVTDDYLYRSPARAWNNLGWAYYKMSRIEEALAAYQKALQIAPSFCQALHNVALVHIDRKNMESAAIFAEKAVQSCPDDLRFRLHLGVVQGALQRLEEAQANLQLVVDKDPGGTLGAQAKDALKGLR